MRLQRFARPDDDARALGIQMHDVERLAGRDADAAALADRVAQDAVVPAEHPPVDMDDLARRGRSRLQLGDDVGIFALRDEADVLAVLLGGDGEAHGLGCLAHLRLGKPAQREAQEVDLRLGGGEEEIALVAVGVDRPVERAVGAIGLAADVVARRQCVRAELARGRQQVGELDGLVARHAGDGRLAGDIALREGVDHGFLETLLVVKHVMGNAERLGDAAGVVDVLAGAARTGAVHRGTMIVELQRHADDIVAFLLQEAGDDRGIHTAGHGDDDPCRFRSSGQVEAVHDVLFRLALLCCGAGARGV